MSPAAACAVLRELARLDTNVSFVDYTIDGTPLDVHSAYTTALSVSSRAPCVAPVHMLPMRSNTRLFDEDDYQHFLVRFGLFLYGSMTVMVQAYHAACAALFEEDDYVLVSSLRLWPSSMRYFDALDWTKQMHIDNRFVSQRSANRATQSCRM
jgi:hypothetical protein